MGHLIVAILGVVVIGGLIAALVGLGGRKPKRGTLPDKSVSYSEPAADEPTPARSATASNANVRAADTKTPPA